MPVAGVADVAESSAESAAEGGDVALLTAARDWLQAGEQVAMVTVLATWGSSPRPPGSLLAISAAGRLVGSVSGGCVESGLLQRLQAGEFNDVLPQTVDIGVDHQQAGQHGLPCGGQLRLLVERLQSAAQLDSLLQGLQQGRQIARRVCLNTGEVSLHPLAATGAEFRSGASAVTRVFGPAWSLLLIGDGQLARTLAAMALMLDYRVTICDPRAEFADPNPLAGVSYSKAMPDDAVRALADQARCAIVTLAHDPRQDDMALLEALPSQAFYVGALGSRRTAAARRERLQTMGLQPAQIARLHAPAGLNVGSHRPAEIALSMLAEVTAVRNGVRQIAST